MDAYSERNYCVSVMAKMAMAIGWTVGIRRTEIVGWDDCWQNCVWIDFPEGQASWHYHDVDAHLFEVLPPYEKEWDGHSTEGKYQMLRRLRLNEPPCEECQIKKTAEALAETIANREAKPKVEEFVLVELPPQTEPVRFIFRRMKVEATEDQCKYYIEEHTCPINWMQSVEAIHIERLGPDPHGLFKYLGRVVAPEGLGVDDWVDEPTICDLFEQTRLDQEGEAPNLWGEDLKP